MKSNHISWNLVPMCTALMLTSMIFGCGLDFGPGTIAVDSSSNLEDCQIDNAQTDFSEATGSRTTLTVVPSLEGMPTEFQRFLEANPTVVQSLIWVDAENPRGGDFIKSERKIQDLVAHLVGEARLEAPPVPVKHDGDARAYFTEEDAWNMYLAHVAHTLRLEVYNQVPWSLADYTEEEQALFFDSRYFVTYVPSEGLYKFSLVLPGGRHGVTDWSPEVGYDFLQKNGMITTQAETVYNFTNWMRQNLVHSNTGTPDDWDQYPGFPTVEAILNPPEGERNWTNGCSGTTSLYIAVLQSINIPVMRGISYFAVQGGAQQPHARVVFPSLGIGLAHTDDAYNSVNRRGVNEVPVEEMFYTLDELRTFIDEPAMDADAPSTGEQAYYNLLRRIIHTAYVHRADSMLKRRARSLLGYEEDSLENLLTGSVCNMSQCLWKPLFDSEERQIMTDEIDVTLTEIGSGDILEGARSVLGR